MTSCVSSTDRTTSLPSHGSVDAASDPWETATPEPVSCDDPDLVIAALQVRGMDAERSAATDGIRTAQYKVTQARARAREARERAEKAAKQGGLWNSFSKVMKGDVATTAAAVASVAAVAASGGAATPLVVAGAALALRGGAQLSEHLGGNRWLTAGLTLGAAATGLLSGNAGAAGAAATSFQSAATVVANTANCVEAGAQVAGGAGTVVAGQYQKKAQLTQTAVVRAESSAEDQQRKVDGGLEQLSRVSKTEHKVIAMTSENQAIQEKSTSAVLTDQRGSSC
jgi:hypothetical protein